MRGEIEQARADAEGLERLYRQAVKSQSQKAFRDAMAEYAEAYPEEALLSAWAYRLDLKPIPGGPDAASAGEPRRWWIAVPASVVLGGLYVLLAGDKPPVPVPQAANLWFWVGWSPLAALGVLFYLAASHWTSERAPWYAASAAAASLVALATVWTVLEGTDGVRTLAAIHLPLIMWAVVGGAVSVGNPAVTSQFSAYILKSVETFLTAGIFLAAGMLFAVLTVGMFAALDVTVPQPLLQRFAAWGIGVVPILAVASVYSPSRSPIAQDWTAGLSRLLRILTRLMLAPALLLLAVYLFWFIPLYFWRPFVERDVLIVYNITVMAIIALLLSAAPSPGESRLARYDSVLRYAILATALLACILNAYALVAVVSRAVEHGLSLNRHAVLGWNIITLLMLSAGSIQLWRAGTDRWPEAFWQSMGRLVVLAIAWGLWVLFGLPRFS